MARVISRTPLANGLTEVRVDVDGINVVPVMMVTSQAHTMTDAELADVVVGMTSVVRKHEGK